MLSSFRSIAVLAASAFIGLSVQTRADEFIVEGRRQTGAGVTDQDLRSLKVTIDFAKLVTFSEPARTVIIGNPGIVDGTLSDEHTIVLTGKVAGVTNLIVLGEGGQEVLNTVVSVSTGSHQTTTVHSGAAQTTFSCTGSCKPVLTVGDDPARFGITREQIKGRQDFQIGGAAPR
jgi:Flp pilus assembly secretin CpaC